MAHHDDEKVKPEDQMDDQKGKDKSGTWVELERASDGTRGDAGGVEPELAGAAMQGADKALATRDDSANQPDADRA